MTRYRYLVPLEDAVHSKEFGGKATQLNLAIKHKLPVPKGFVISNSLLVQVIQGKISLADELSLVLSELGPIAVRSSAIGEDSKSQSYAGQYVSLLNVASVTEAEQAIIAVQQSAYSKRVKLYNERFGIADVPKMAVLLQQMVTAKTSGILFTKDPVTNTNEIIIEANWGLGETIASGQVIPDFFRLSREGQILDKKAGNGTERCANDLCLNEMELRQLHQLAKYCEHVFGKDLDMEWTFDQQCLYLLQCRPITC